MIEFINTFKSTMMATVDAEFFPHASYAPFVHINHRYYVFISSMAKHTQNLQSNCEVSLLFIEDEIKADNIFARKRIALLCYSTLIARDDLTFTSVIDAFVEKFDHEIMDILVGMSDFNLYEMRPEKGEAVFGFGEAYDVGGAFCEELIQREGGSGHSRDDEAV